MKKILVFLLVALLLVGCGGASEGDIQTAIAETETAKPTEADTPTAEDISTDIPKPTVTSAPTNTLTPTTEPTSTPEPTKLPLLVNLLITADEMNALIDAWKDTPVSVDEFVQNCDYDCTDSTWFSKSDDMYIQVRLVKREDISDAEYYANQLKDAYTGKGYILLENPNDDLFTIPQNTWFAKSDTSYLFVASYKDILVAILTNDPSGSDDSDIGAVMGYYMHQQVEKLKDAGY